MIDRINATDAALALIDKLVAIHGPLMFYQGGGCCEGSAPICFPRGEFKLGSKDLLLGEVGGHPFHINPSQFEYYQHSQLTLDVVEGSGAGFSLEAPEKLAFITRSRLFTDEEVAILPPVTTSEGEPYKAPAPAP